MSNMFCRELYEGGPDINVKETKRIRCLGYNKGGRRVAKKKSEGDCS